MKFLSPLRSAVIGLIAITGLTTNSLADSGNVRMTIYKAGFVIGGSGGNGTLNFHGRTYGLSVGGVDYGLVFGGSKTECRDA